MKNAFNDNYVYEDGDNFLSVNKDGTISVSAYSYTIDSCGGFELNQDQARELYEALKDHYN